MARQPCWTDSVAVGSEVHVREVESRIKQQHTEVRMEAGAWIVREVRENLTGKTQSMR